MKLSHICFLSLLFGFMGTLRADEGESEVLLPSNKVERSLNGRGEIINQNTLEALATNFGSENLQAFVKKALESLGAVWLKYPSDGSTGPYWWHLYLEQENGGLALWESKLYKSMSKDDDFILTKDKKLYWYELKSKRYPGSEVQLILTKPGMVAFASGLKGSMAGEVLAELPVSEFIKWLLSEKTSLSVTHPLHPDEKMVFEIKKGLRQEGVIIIKNP